MTMMLTLALAAQTMAAPAAVTPSVQSPACNQPVVMVVAGPTHDRARMLTYGQAIADSGLYRQLGGYYINVPRPLATFEGTPPPGYTVLLVRFPCLANAQAFWNSRVYQEEIKPLRLNPSAGDYIVTVYPEAPVRPDMAEAVGSNAYVQEFDASAVPQAGPGAP